MPLFAIVSPEDHPVYQTSFPNMSGKVPTCIEQLVLHSSLDMVDEKMWDQREFYLKVVDRYGSDQVVFAYVTPTNYRFLLLHDRNREDGIKSFFTEIHEIFIRFTLNPLWIDGSPIKSPAFNERVLLIGRRYL